MKKYYLIIMSLLLISSCKSNLVTIDTNTESEITVNEEKYKSPVELKLQINKSYLIKFSAPGYIEASESILIKPETKSIFITLNKTETQILKEKELMFKQLTNIILESEIEYYDQPYEKTKYKTFKAKEKLKILSRTSWYELENDREFYWLKVESKYRTSWIKSHHFNPRIIYDQIPIDKFTKNTQKTETMNGIEIDHTSFPIIGRKYFDLFNTMSEPNTEEALIFFNRDGNQLCLYNIPHPEKNIKIRLKTTDNILINDDIKIDEFIIGKMNEDISGFPFKKFISTINFHPFATYKTGNWNIQLIIDDEYEIERDVYIRSNNYSISKTESPNPFRENSSDIFITGDEIHIWGSNLKPDTSLNVVLYLLTYKKDKNKKFLTYPTYAFTVKTNYDGAYHSTVKLGNDIIPGDYQIAYEYEDEIKLDQIGAYFTLINY